MEFNVQLRKSCWQICLRGERRWRWHLQVKSGSLTEESGEDTYEGCEESVGRCGGSSGEMGWANLNEACGSFTVHTARHSWVEEVLIRSRRVSSTRTPGNNKGFLEYPHSFRKIQLLRSSPGVILSHLLVCSPLFTRRGSSWRVMGRRSRFTYIHHVGNGGDWASLSLLTEDHKRKRGDSLTSTQKTIY